MDKKLFLFIALVLFCIRGYGQRPVNPIILGKVRFTIITPELIRMEYATDGKFLDDPTLFAVNRNSRTDSFKVTHTGNDYVIKTKRMEVHYKADDLPFSQKNIRIIVNNQPKNYEWRIYSQDDKNLGGTLSTLDEISGSVKTDDGLLSRNGWHLIDDSGKEVLKNEWIAQRPVNHYRDLYFFAYGNDYKSGLKALTQISGNIPMNRKYVHGVWYCRWWDYTSKDFLDIIDGYKKNDFPIDVLAMDMGWHTQKEATTGMGHAGIYGWTGYTWNNKLIPDPKDLLTQLKNDSVYIALNDHPHDGIRHHEKYYPDFMKAMGEDTLKQEKLLFNAGSKKYMNNFFKYALKPNEDMGVNFWWLDWQQDYVMPHVLGYENLKHLPWLNHLYFDHSKDKGQRGLLFSRWSGWGSHRTPIQFSGDAVATWDMLKFEVPFTASSSNAGCFFWAHDVGGFYGERDTELYIRWSQFALTTAALRIHSVYSKDLDRRPWLWGDIATKALRKVYHLRSQLMPYIYSSVYQSHKESLPLIRSMYIDYPSLEKSYENPQQYMFGDVLLSAPIVSKGSSPEYIASQKIWFPPNENWYDISTHEEYEGGSTITVTKDIYNFPLYVKGGIPLPMQPYQQRMASAALHTLIIRCYPGKIGQTGVFQLYEDDGISNDYTNGNYYTTRLSYTQNSENQATINIEKALGKGYKDAVKKRTYKIELPVFKITTVIVNGKKTKVQQDSDGKAFITIALAPVSTSQKIQISY
ncbi:glycoside hydrolase family 31 protein [Elizabethkingia bruuniana]|uniref:glycoside hydrolase family 31 protein n=1 Tax=Elizabethkingia bruuniana TaxID=1756149 RepID=UPI00241CD31E|nr:glycoside hydrolase family 31 protein [Elizabethkingia bruuniana]